MRPTTPTRLAALLAAFVSLLPGAALAADYGTFIDVETEDQLLDLLAAQEIEQSTYEALSDLLNDGIDLNLADREEIFALPNLTYEEVDRILEYRKLGGSLQDPAQLVVAGILSERKLLAISAFLIVTEVQQAKLPVKGRLRYRTIYVAGDKQVPSMYLGARVNAFKQLDVGVIGVLTRNKLSNVAWDPNRNALSADPPSIQFEVPKFHVQWETSRWHIIGGTFRAGFGQRLTLDNTNRYNPNGFRLDDQMYNVRDLVQACHESAGELSSGLCGVDEANLYQAPDFKWPERFRGVAVGLKHLDFGPGWLQAYAFGSYQTKSIYQYQIVDAERCPDPGDSSNPGCVAPMVYRHQGDLLAPTSRYSFMTLPNMYNELVAGGNVSYFFKRRAHLGVTGYGADISWLSEGAKLDFQDWARTPYGGAFGAVGVDAAWGHKWIDLGAEVARSFDHQATGGGWAAIVRGTMTLAKHNEIEISGRYFSTEYNNPLARPISAIDQYEGLRAANEAGARIRHIGSFGDLEMRSIADLWWELSSTTPKIRIKSRAEYDVVPWFKPALWVDYIDKDLVVSGNGQCYDTPFDTVEGEPVPCKGQKVQVGMQLKFMPKRNLTMTVKYLHRFVDDTSFPTSFRQDISLWATAMYAPVDKFFMRFRLRYLNEDVSSDTRMEDSIWAYLEGVLNIKAKFRMLLRYEIYAYIDKRASTAERNPNPSHWLRLNLEYKF